MYSLSKRRVGNNIKVKDLIAELEKENPEAAIVCCGDDRLFIHVEEDNSVVNIDVEDLSDYDEYKDFNDGVDTIPEIERQSIYLKYYRNSI